MGILRALPQLHAAGKLSGISYSWSTMVHATTPLATASDSGRTCAGSAVACEGGAGHHSLTSRSLMSSITVVRGAEMGDVPSKQDSAAMHACQHSVRASKTCSVNCKSHHQLQPVKPVVCKSCGTCLPCTRSRKMMQCTEQAQALTTGDH